MVATRGSQKPAGEPAGCLLASDGQSAAPRWLRDSGDSCRSAPNRAVVRWPIVVCPPAPRALAEPEASRGAMARRGERAAAGGLRAGPSCWAGNWRGATLPYYRVVFPQRVSFCVDALPVSSPSPHVCAVTRVTATTTPTKAAAAKTPAKASAKTPAKAAAKTTANTPGKTAAKTAAKTRSRVAGITPPARDALAAAGGKRKRHSEGEGSPGTTTAKKTLKFTPATATTAPSTTTTATAPSSAPSSASTATATATAAKVAGKGKGKAKVGKGKGKAKPKARAAKPKPSPKATAAGEQPSAGEEETVPAEAPAGQEPAGQEEMVPAEEPAGQEPAGQEPVLEAEEPVVEAPDAAGEPAAAPPHPCPPSNTAVADCPCPRPACRPRHAGLPGRPGRPGRSRRR